MSDSYVPHKFLAVRLLLLLLDPRQERKQGGGAGKSVPLSCVTAHSLSKTQKVM